MNGWIYSCVLFIKRKGLRKNTHYTGYIYYGISTLSAVAPVQMQDKVPIIIQT